MEGHFAHILLGAALLLYLLPWSGLRKNLLPLVVATVSLCAVWHTQPSNPCFHLAWGEHSCCAPQVAPATAQTFEPMPEVVAIKHPPVLLKREQASSRHSFVSRGPPVMEYVSFYSINV